MSRSVKKKAIVAVAIAAVLVAGLFAAMSTYADRRSCICYEVGKESVTRPIGDEITDMYVPAPGTFTMTKYTCRHNKSMWLWIFWDDGYYRITGE